MWTSDTELMQHSITTEHLALSLYATLRDTCMGKNYLASGPQHNTLH